MKPLNSGSPQGEDATARQRMVADQLRRRGISDARVLDAMGRVPREWFVEPFQQRRAYDDMPLPIGLGQTISQPYMVARMLELLELTGHGRVLEIGTGSGYQAAVLGLLADEVYTVERLPVLAESARHRIAELGLHHVTVGCFDGTTGWPEHAPFDGIVVAAGAPSVPDALQSQLADGGRLVIPVGDPGLQRLAIITRHGDTFDTDWDTPCTFVPLLGRRGWPTDDPGEN